MGTVHFIWENYRFWIWDVKYYNTSSDFHLFSSTHVCNILFFFSWFIVHSNHCIYNYEFFLFEEFLYNLKRTNMRECDSDALICHFCSSNSKVPRAEVELQKSIWVNSFAFEWIFSFLWAVRCCSKPLSLQDTRLRRINHQNPTGSPYDIESSKLTREVDVCLLGSFRPSFCLSWYFSWQKCFQRWTLKPKGHWNYELLPEANLLRSEKL